MAMQNFNNLTYTTSDQLFFLFFLLYGMYVSVTEVMELLRELSSGKASGMDGLTGESLKYANHILPVLLSICFTCMFKHCYLPSNILDSVIVPLVKKQKF